MAKIFGTPGGYVKNQSVNRFLNMFFGLLIGIGVICYLVGLGHGLLFGKNKYANLAVLAVLLIAALIFFFRNKLSHRLDKLTEEIIAFRKGAEGEHMTAELISELPDSYSVIHDVNHSSIYGNIDHIVVGPTGVFALETKDWHGMVTLSGNKTLKLDDKYNKSKDANQILQRSLNLSNKIEALSGVKTFVQAVMVFPHASVSVLPGTKSSLDVQRLKHLEEYLKKTVPSRALTTKQVETITSDLKALFKV